MANIVVVVGAGFALWQVMELRADRRRDNAMQYVLLLHNDTYANAALDVSTAIQERASDNDSRLALRNFQRLGDLYLSVITCRANNICDAKTIDSNFRGDIAGFYGLTKDQELVRISCRLSNSPGSYGAGILAYLNATRPAGEPPAVAPASQQCE